MWYEGIDIIDYTRKLTIDQENKDFLIDTIWLLKKSSICIKMVSKFMRTNLAFTVQLLKVERQNTRNWVYWLII